MIVLHKQCNLNFQERTGFFFTVYLNSYIIVAIWENSDGQTDAPLSLELKFYRASILIVITYYSHLLSYFAPAFFEDEGTGLNTLGIYIIVYPNLLNTSFE